MRAEPVEGQRLHFAGVVLPEGEHRDLWVVDGVIRTEPIRDARDRRHERLADAGPC